MPSSTELFRRYLNPVFIETGTWDGQGVRRALAAGFETVYSVDISDDFKDERARVARCPRVHLSQGDSPPWLAGILESLDRPATIWLDAHGELCDETCPLERELAVIRDCPHFVETVLIDDMRLMRERQSRIIDMLFAIDWPVWIGFADDGQALRDILVATRRRPW
jgi:hypothetical protein